MTEILILAIFLCSTFDVACGWRAFAVCAGLWTAAFWRLWRSSMRPSENCGNVLGWREDDPRHLAVVCSAGTFDFLVEFFRCICCGDYD